MPMHRIQKGQFLKAGTNAAKSSEMTVPGADG